jgi:organic radical activating enzyme
MKVSNFTAADTIPYKLFKNQGLLESIEDGAIPPVHIQFYPTNKCNLHCSFCSCEKRDRGHVMDIGEIREMVAHFASLGTQAVTITGGGEPTLHPDFRSMMRAFWDAYIDIGLVTNGTNFNNADGIEYATWCRVSSADEREMPVVPVDDYPSIDWAFSYVLSAEPDIDNIVEHIEFANANDFTHVRIVSDILDLGHMHMEEAKKAVAARVDDSLVVWQGRQSPVRGAKDCRISVLKPLIGPDGQMFPCCSIQYAREIPDLSLPPDMSMGHWRDFDSLKHFDGSRCKNCYYDGYNTVLEELVHDRVHVPFV